MAKIPQHRWIESKTFGRVRLIASIVTTPDGPQLAWDYDPEFEPALPRNALRGDIGRQKRYGGEPRYWYVDESRECLQCGRGFLFLAGEQKYWFETLQFHPRSTAIRCAECRRRKRTASMLQTAVCRATAACRERPDDALAHLELARALLALFERTGNVLWPMRSPPSGGQLAIHCWRRKPACFNLPRFFTA